MPVTKELKDRDTLIEHSFMFKNQFMIIKSVRKKKELLERKLNGKKAKQARPYPQLDCGRHEGKQVCVKAGIWWSKAL